MEKARLQVVHDPDEQFDSILCPNCLTANELEADLCCQCAAPLSCHAGIDPWHRIQATGDTYRKAIYQSSSRVALWGIVMLFGRGFILWVIATVAMILAGVGGLTSDYMISKADTELRMSTFISSGASGLGIVLGVVYCGLMFWLHGAILKLAIKGIRQRRRERMEAEARDEMGMQTT